jgi:hypothetical protein
VRVHVGGLCVRYGRNVGAGRHCQGRHYCWSVQHHAKIRRVRRARVRGSRACRWHVTSCGFWSGSAVALRGHVTCLLGPGGRHAAWQTHTQRLRQRAQPSNNSVPCCTVALLSVLPAKQGASSTSHRSLRIGGKPAGGVEDQAGKAHTV